MITFGARNAAARRRLRDIVKCVVSRQKSKTILRHAGAPPTQDTRLPTGYPNAPVPRPSVRARRFVRIGTGRRRTRREPSTQPAPPVDRRRQLRTLDRGRTLGIYYVLLQFSATPP